MAKTFEQQHDTGILGGILPGGDWHTWSAEEHARYGSYMQGKQSGLDWNSSFGGNKNVQERVRNAYQNNEDAEKASREAHQAMEEEAANDEAWAKSWNDGLLGSGDGTSWNTQPYTGDDDYDDSQQQDDQSPRTKQEQPDNPAEDKEGDGDIEDSEHTPQSEAGDTPSGGGETPLGVDANATPGVADAGRAGAETWDTAGGFAEGLNEAATLDGAAGAAGSAGLAGVGAVEAGGAAVVEGGAVVAEGATAGAAFFATPAGWVTIIVLVVILIFFILAWLFYVAHSHDPASTPCPTASASASKTIVIDPGHPSEVGSGATGGGLTEVAKVYEIANLIKPKLESKGYTVVLTRTNNTTIVTNKQRADIANSNNALIFFRIHDDGRGTNRGVAFYYPAKAGTVNGITGPSQSVITKSQAAASTIFNTSSNSFTSTGMPLYRGGLLTDASTAEGTKHGGALAGSIYSTVPTVLVEVGSLGSPEDVAWLKNSTDLDTAAQGMADGIAAAAPLTVTQAHPKTNPLSFMTSFVSIAFAATDGCPISAPGGGVGALLAKASEYVKNLSLYQTKMVKSITDCWGFVATVLKNSIDPSVIYGMRAADAPSQYFSKHPDKYQVFPVHSPSVLQPGDMLFNTVQGSHAEIWVGKGYDGCSTGVFSASLGGHPPECSPSSWYPAMSVGVRIK